MSLALEGAFSTTEPLLRLFLATWLFGYDIIDTLKRKPNINEERYYILKKFLTITETSVVANTTHLLSHSAFTAKALSHLSPHSSLTTIL